MEVRVLTICKACQEERVGIHLETINGCTRVKRLTEQGLAVSRCDAPGADLVCMHALAADLACVHLGQPPRARGPSLPDARPTLPQAKAGLQVGDVVLAVEDTRVQSFSHGAELISCAHGEVRVEVERRARLPDPAVYQGDVFAQALHGVAAIGHSAYLKGEEEAKPTLRPPIKPEAKMRLFALYGMGSFALSLHPWWSKAPGWLEVRPIELPGHGWRERDPLPLCEGSSSHPAKFADATLESPPFIETSFSTKREYEAHLAGLASAHTKGSELAPLEAGRQVFIRELCDMIAPLLNAPYALFGFSNGAMIAFLMAVELERRGAPLPCRIFCAGRGPPHIQKWPARSLLNILRMTDEETISFAEAGGILAPASERGGMRLNPRFAPVTRSGVVGMFGVGKCRDDVDVNDGSESYLLNPPQLQQVPITALLSREDHMWPSDRYLSRWRDVTRADFRGVVVSSVPHHQFQGHVDLRNRVYSELAHMLRMTLTPYSLET